MISLSNAMQELQNAMKRQSNALSAGTQTVLLLLQLQNTGIPQNTFNQIHAALNSNVDEYPELVKISTDNFSIHNCFLIQLGLV